MAANASQAKALSILHRAKVADYATWSLTVACKSCGVQRTIPLAELPPELTIIQTLTRMRCRRCRGQVHAAALNNNVPGWRARIVQVWGPGSYG